ncbi:kinase-like domain-containing protein, partial [Lactifluus subvellereus]
LSWDLIEGLAYLFEHGVVHLDIKPRDPIYADDFHLQIIDFDSAVRVRSEDDVLEGVYGARGWMAPEIRERGVYLQC